MFFAHPQPGLPGCRSVLSILLSRHADAFFFIEPTEQESAEQKKHDQGKNAEPASTGKLAYYPKQQGT